MYLSGDVFKNVCLEKVLQIIIEVSMLRSLILDILPGSWLKLQRPPCKYFWWKFIKKESPKSDLCNKNKQQCFQIVLDWTGTLFSRACFWCVWSRNRVPWNREKSVSWSKISLDLQVHPLTPFWANFPNFYQLKPQKNICKALWSPQLIKKMKHWLKMRLCTIILLEYIVFHTSFLLLRQ